MNGCDSDQLMYRTSAVDKSKMFSAFHSKQCSVLMNLCIFGATVKEKMTKHFTFLTHACRWKTAACGLPVSQTDLSVWTLADLRAAPLVSLKWMFFIADGSCLCPVANSIFLSFDCRLLLHFVEEENVSRYFW